MFKIKEQPHEKQRKSYKNENRYLLPHPLVICPVQPEAFDLLGGVQGTVRVCLTDEGGDELADQQQRFLSGTKEKRLNHGLHCEFALKILETSEKQKMRLCFRVTYVANGVEHHETILSHPFRVFSNKRMGDVGPPTVLNLLPKCGHHGTDTEVWIKGRNFTDRMCMSVRFGDQEAVITETEENLITCIAPAQPNLPPDADTPVAVTVTNFHPAQGPLMSDSLAYVYKRPKKSKRCSEFSGREPSLSAANVGNSSNNKNNNSGIGGALNKRRAMIFKDEKPPSPPRSLLSQFSVTPSHLTSLPPPPPPLPTPCSLPPPPPHTTAPLTFRHTFPPPTYANFDTSAPFTHVPAFTPAPPPPPTNITPTTIATSPQPSSPQNLDSILKGQQLDIQRQLQALQQQLTQLSQQQQQQQQHQTPVANLVQQQQFFIPYIPSASFTTSNSTSTSLMFDPLNNAAAMPFTIDTCNNNTTTNNNNNITNNYNTNNSSMHNSSALGTSDMLDNDALDNISMFDWFSYAGNNNNSNTTTNKSSNINNTFSDSRP